MKKIGLLCLALVLALGTLGVGFALWSETLYIDGTVYTGEVDAEWTACYCFDGGFDPNPDGSNKGKDVGSTTCIIGADPHYLLVTVENAYPCYWNDCEVEFTNTGTVPFIIEDFIITPGAGTTLASANGANDGQIWVKLVDGIGSQLHPGDEAGSSLKFHVEQCAAQNATYTFTVEILVVQYNESIYY